MNHGQRKASTGRTIQQGYQSATKTQTVSKSCGTAGSEQECVDSSANCTMPHQGGQII